LIDLPRIKNCNMKSVSSFILAASLIIVLANCKTKPEASSAEWKEMDDFHMIMAETFHPFKDSADLQPVKAKASELKAAAEAWANSPIPEKADDDHMKSHLQELRSEAEALEDIVRTGTDTEIGSQLTKVHDKFHHIQEAWYGGDEKKQ
jgi:hypothetical protein